MTSAEAEALFIQLWNAGTETAEIARQFGLKVTTAQSRAHRLQQQGLIQPRPRGGNYPTERVKARAPGEGGPSTIHRPPSTLPPWTVHRLTVHRLPSTLTPGS